jgi:lysophospholipase
MPETGAATATLAQHARNPVPSGARSGVFEAHDGVRLRYALWDASRRPRRGTVCVFGGRGEFIEKYFEVIADLRRRGFVVATMDWRGQGGSERELRNPRKGYVADFADHDADLMRFMKSIVLPDCPPPYIALAHSTGGNILLRNATVEGSWFDRMVLTAPLIRFSPDTLPFPQRLVHMMAALGCAIGLGEKYARSRDNDDVALQMPFHGNDLTSDPERFERNYGVLRMAPDLALGGPTLYWLRAACRSMRKIDRPQFSATVKVPILLVAAGSDRVVCSKAIDEFVENVKIGSRVLIPDSRHEILQERDAIRQQFWATFDAFVMGETLDHAAE